MPEHTLVLRFLAELLRKTIDIHNDNDFQAVVQSFANELLPWVRPADLAWPPRHNYCESVDMTEALVGFRGRGFNSVVQRDLCTPYPLRSHYVSMTLGMS